MSVSFMPTESIIDQWDQIRFYGLTPGRSYEISMGSGFFINRDTIITNRHVVEKCRNIAVRGAIAPTIARLELVDKSLDLAALEIAKPIDQRVPYLRVNHDETTQKDILFSVGYPLERGQTGKYLIKDAEVISVKKDKRTGFRMIEFTDSINYGNSGGPLLDRNSNLVGVVTAKLTYQRIVKGDIQERIVAFAIGVEGLIDFLKKNDIPFSASSTYDIFTNYHLDRLVKEYVVNIHCVK